MKKLYSFFMILSLLVSNGIQAQDNSYNMVIEMANGTKISIGPNDVKSVTFNDGQLVVTGEDLQSWLTNIAASVEDNKTKISTLQKEVYSWQSYIDNWTTSMETMKANMVNANNQIIALNTNMVKNSTSIDELFSRIEQLSARIASLEQGNTEPEQPSATITVTTYDASEVAETSATLNGSISVSNTTKNYTAGFFLSTSGTPSNINYTKKVEAGSNKTANYTASVTGLSENTTYRYRAYVLYEGEYYYGETASFTTKEADHTKGVLNGHEWVDLGLPSGTKWATCNVGASKPEDYGGYYAWGETEEKTSCTMNTYTFFIGSGAGDLRYSYVAKDISGTSKDVAYVKWGSNWKMPTSTQKEELISKCTYSWTSINGVSGYKFTGPNGNFIFLPASGYKGGPKTSGGSIYYEGERGYYWTATSNSGYANDVDNLSFRKNDMDSHLYPNSGDGGYNVRPVCQ